MKPGQPGGSVLLLLEFPRWAPWGATGFFSGGDAHSQSLPWVAPGRGLVWLSSADAAITPTSSISSVGIQHQAPGLDPSLAQIWFLDGAAQPVRPCRLLHVTDESSSC